MGYNESNIFYAKDGEYVTITGQPYNGIFHKMPSGALMTGEEHENNSQVIVQVEGRKTAKSSPLQTINTNTDLDENDTVYDLLPVLANKPPVITKPLNEASRPSIKPYSAAKTALQGNYMYLFPDGTVKVHSGTTITLRIEAQQPDVYNVENGVLEIIPPKAKLKYQWTLDGENIVANDAIADLRSSRIVLNNTITIKNICPQFAGTYGCLVSNDVGVTDGGVVNLEVFNSDLDSFFYTNLVQNPNGRIDGELTSNNWNTVGGDVTSRTLTQSSEGFRDKRIAVDPMNPDFRWTKEMLHPKPYQLDSGVLKNNPLKKIDSYFTKENHEYILNGGSLTLEAYQDIDLIDIQNQINGSIYGVGGVKAVVSFYLGMAVHNFIPASPNITPDTIADIDLYRKDHPRMSLYNFRKMGPGFVQERVYVEIEEYNGEERLLSLDSFGVPRRLLDRINDPWNSRLYKYKDQKYFNSADDNVGVSETPDKRDRHLFIMDELQKNPADRYTYGQHAEFHKIEIPYLNPKTNKIRINFTIEVFDFLGYVLQQTIVGLPVTSLQDGVFAQPSWQGTYKRDSLEGITSDPTDERRIADVIRNEYRANAPWPSAVEQRLPKSPLSKAFATGFNLCLIPNEIGKDAETKLVVENIYTQNELVEGLVPGPIVDTTVSTKIEIRHIDVSFGLAKEKNVINVKVESYDPSKPSNKNTEQYIPGLFPFLPSSIINVPSSPKIENSSNLITNPIGGAFNNMVQTNGVLSPIYAQPFEDQLNTRYTQLHDKPLDKGVTNNLFDPTPTIAPKFPVYWYTIRDKDKLAIYNTGSVALDAIEKYTYWAVPGSDLNYKEYVQEWNEGPFDSALGFFKPQMDERETAWMQESRFIITVGVHRTDVAESGSLFAIDSYYLDCRANEAIIHKTPNLGGVEYLPSFDTFEFPSTNDITNMSSTTANTAFAVQGLTSTNNTSVAGTSVFKSYGSESVSMKPVVIDIQKAVGSQTKTAGIPLPDEFLTRSRFQGGLGIPQIDVSGSMVLDPNYKVCLYGVRPATLANRVDGFETAREGSDIIMANTFIGTPLSGKDSTRKLEYIVQNIKIEQIEIDEGDTTDPLLDYSEYNPPN